MIGPVQRKVALACLAWASSRRVSFEPTSWSPDRDRASDLCDEAQGLEDAGSADDAERLYREAIALDPEFVRPRVLLGSLLGETPGTRRAGIREINRALELDPDHPRALARLGSLLMSDGRCAEAEPVLKRALALDPSTWTCVFLGVCVESLGRCDEAVAFYREALTLDPENDEALYDLAYRLRFADPAAAEAYLRRAIEIDPLYALAWGELGHVLLLQGRTEQAVDALERSVALEPTHHWHQLRMAVSLLRMGRCSEAGQHLSKALQLRHALTTREHLECLGSDLASEGPQAWSRLYRGYLLGRRLEFDAALKLVEGASVDSPLQALNRALLADQALWKVLDGECEDLGERVDLLRFALDQDPDHPEVWEQLGKARYGWATDIQAGRARATEPLEVVLTQSREALERAISLAPDRPFAHLYLGLAYKLSGRQRPAELELRRALALGTGGIHAAVFGDHLADLDRFEEAESVFQQALEDYPDWAMAWRDYGRTLIRDRHPRGDENLPRAADAFERALLLQPENAENHYRLADVLSCIHEDFLPRAKALLERCLELRPSHPRARGTLAEVERLLRAGGG